MIRDLVVNLATTTKHDRARDYAISLGEQFNAHVTGIAFAYEPIISVMSNVEGLPATYIEEERAANEKAARTAKEKFLQSNTAVRCESYSPQVTVSGAASLFAKFSRNYDLCVIEQADTHTSHYDFLIEAALFDSGRPVFVIPYIHNKPAKFETALVCWDGSRQAARATADAMPFLRKAKRIQIITVAEANKVTEDLPGAEIAQHLSRHGLSVQTKRIDVEDIDIANVILSHATDIDADFIAMGAYGHTRLREFVFGGVTAQTLATMTVPVLMSH
jgi:nucleotide-binding universal stress UspA family protein